METLLLGSVVGIGYLLSKNGKNSRTEESDNTAFKDPSQNSIYSSTYLNNTKEQEFKLAQNMSNKSKNAIDTNVDYPKSIKDIMVKEKKSSSIENYSELKEYLLQRN